MGLVSKVSLPESLWEQILIGFPRTSPWPPPGPWGNLASPDPPPGLPSRLLGFLELLKWPFGSFSFVELSETGHKETFLPEGFLEWILIGFFFVLVFCFYWGVLKW